MDLINNPVTITSPTSSFPYEAEGPVDFSNTNFVRTCQTDYYYDASETTQLASEVRQCNEPLATFWTLIGISTIFILLVSFCAYAFAKKYKSS